MRQQFNHHFIKTFYRKLRLPKNLVYSTSRMISNISTRKIHEKNKINLQSNIVGNNFIPYNLGYKLFKSQDAKELENIVNICQSIFEQNKNKYNEAKT